MAIRTALHLTSRQVHVRVIPLPAPMRDPKTLRTLVLLDLESHPPSAAIDRVQVRLEPTPGRVLQWTLFERAQPAPEQVATLLARLTALMGDGHVGLPGARGLVASRCVCDGAVRPRRRGPPHEPPRPAGDGAQLPLAFRRFRLPVPVRVRVDDGRPIAGDDGPPWHHGRRHRPVRGSLAHVGGVVGDGRRSGVGSGESGVGKARRTGPEAAGWS